MAAAEDQRLCEEVERLRAEGKIDEAARRVIERCRLELADDESHNATLERADAFIASHTRNEIEAYVRDAQAAYERRKALDGDADE